MLELGSIGFAQPWLLLGLLALPGLWWLLRLTPPPPRRIGFPAFALLRDLTATEESPARMPWWLLLLRFAVAALVILAAAEPVLAPQRLLAGNGPVVVALDNTWASADDWEQRRTVLRNILDEADRAGRPVTLLTTAATAEVQGPPSLRTAAAWRVTAGALSPEPWAPDYAAAVERIGELRIEGSAEAVWIAGPLAHAGVRELAERLQRLGRLTVFRGEGQIAVLDEPGADPGGLVLSARRLSDAAAASFTVQALGEDGRVLAAAPLEFPAGDLLAESRWRLPKEAINRIRRLRLADTAGAGATVMLDDRWQRRSVGLVQGTQSERGHPLLDPEHYLGSALASVATLMDGDLSDLLDERPSMLIVREGLQPDVATAGRLKDWLEAGGVLVRFAGAGVAEASRDEAGRAWLPVRLRPAARMFGGAMTWSEPQSLAEFPANSPFVGLATPDDVSVRQQVLAEPAPDLREKTWATLADGTPLVTADRRGDGRVVLVHVAADPRWSSLPLSGLFVEMLTRLVRMGDTHAAAAVSDRLLPAIRVLDGFGEPIEPPPTVLPLPPGALPAAPGPAQPPGLYGTGESLRAFNLSAGNLSAGVTDLVPAPGLPSGVAERSVVQEPARDLGAWLWLAALALLIADFAVSLWLRGHFGKWQAAGTAAAVVLGIGLGVGLPALMGAGQTFAQTNGVDLGLAATMDTHLAYIETGDPEVDRISEAGLTGLSWILADRTSVEPGRAMGVNLETTELAFFPLLYWPITAAQPIPSAQVRRRIAAYLANGGTILFDTREPVSGRTAGRMSPGQQRLRQLTDGVAIPPLEPVSPGHVLTKAFYLLDDFPGRYAGRPVWVEVDADAARDGVSSVIVGSHDWAAAWALSSEGRPLYAVSPGGERQREFAFRFGVNLVMHVLTGNYKGDQVHVPSILERLGQ